MSDEKLLPCPFCGGEAELMRFPKCDRKYVVICENKQCMASVGNYSYTKEEAIKAWNTRKPMERIVERLEELKQRAWDEKYQTLCDAIDIVKEEGGKEV